MEATETTRATTESQAVHRAASALLASVTATSSCPTDAVEEVKPIFAKAKGASVMDLDGNEYIDFDGAGGAMLLGHGDDGVTVAVNKIVSKGVGFDSPSVGELKLAELLAGHFDAIERMLFVNSASEAMGIAMTVAQVQTGRAKNVMMVGRRAAQKGSVNATDILDVPFGDRSALTRLLTDEGDTIASVVVSPVLMGGGLEVPDDGFLAEVRQLCDQFGAFLILDERLTGLRLGPGGASARYDVRPDLMVLGGSLCAGYPLAVVGGSKELSATVQGSPRLQRLIDDAWGGNPVGVVAATASIQATGGDGFYEELEAKSAHLEEGVRAAIVATGCSVEVVRVGSMLGLRFAQPVGGASSPVDTDAPSTTAPFRFCHALHEHGVWVLPTSTPTLYVSAAHSQEQIDRGVEVVHQALSVSFA